MADEVDVANDYAERFLQSQLDGHAYQSNRAVSAHPVGEVRNCSSRLDDGRAFCDPDCASDWHDRQMAAKRNGKYRGG